MFPLAVKRLCSQEEFATGANVESSPQRCVCCLTLRNLNEYQVEPTRGLLKRANECQKRAILEKWDGGLGIEWDQAEARIQGGLSTPFAGEV
jgi:hypothetical protein